MPDLGELETFIKEYKHLPGMPTKKEIEQKGQNLGVIQLKLLQKIEELILYMIEMNKQVKSLKAENEELKREVKLLKNSN